MKKLVLAAIAAIALPTLVLAQGTVTFGSSGANALSQYFQYENLDKAQGIQAQLWWSPDNVAAYQNVASLTTESGTFSGYLFNNAATVTVVGAAGGSTPWFYVAGIDGAMYGASPAFLSAALGNPAGNPPTLPPTLDGWTAPITLTVIPEPSMIALAGLGMGALLLFRRRR